MKLAFVEVAGFRAFKDKTRFDLPGGFAVLTGRNGAGKSTVLDAVDFVLTGTINKYVVKDARGGGLDEHIWWVGEARADTGPETLMQTTLIRDETIAGLSLDLPEQARFSAVRAALGGLAGTDHTERTGALLGAANSVETEQKARVTQAQEELGRALSALAGC